MELVIVVVTIGIMAAMAVPSFMDYFPRLQTRAAIREIASQLRLARSTAITEKRPIGVHFDSYEGGYTVFMDTVDVGSQVFDETDPVIRTTEFPPQVEYGYTTFNNNVVIFDADGSASSSGSITFFSQQDEELYEVSVIAGTGKVRMEEVGAQGPGQ